MCIPIMYAPGEGNVTTPWPTTELTNTYLYAFATLVCMFICKIAPIVLYESSDGNEDSSDGDDSSDDNEDSSDGDNTETHIYKKLGRINSQLNDITDTIDQLCERLASLPEVNQSCRSPRISLSISNRHLQPNLFPASSPLIQQPLGVVGHDTSLDELGSVGRVVEDASASQRATMSSLVEEMPRTPCNPLIQGGCGDYRCSAETRTGRRCKQKGDGGGIINGLCNYHRNKSATVAGSVVPVNPPLQMDCSGYRCRAATRTGRRCRQEGGGGGGGIINGFCGYHKNHRRE